ncbi:MAG: hypothetical protein HY905_05815 [Deltaproteobacteria bacterium]|nr:hypothetical protein [Deltaproteobacteria bacterium]
MSQAGRGGERRWCGAATLLALTLLPAAGTGCGHDWTAFERESVDDDGPGGDGVADGDLEIPDAPDADIDELPPIDDGGAEDAPTVEDAGEGLDADIDDAPWPDEGDAPPDGDDDAGGEDGFADDAADDGPSPPVCGNLVLETGEECDPPGSTQPCTFGGCTGYSLCRDDCFWAACDYGPAPAGDTCDSIISTPPLLPSWGSTRVEGSTCGATDDGVDSACGAVDAPDVLYRLDLSDPAVVTLDTAGSEFDAVLRLADASACPGSELACDDDSSDVAPGQAELVAALEAGSYWVIIDGKNADSEGRYVLNARFDVVGPPPPNDSCTGATRLDLGTSSRSLGGTTIGAGNHPRSCALGVGPDVWYTFTLTERTLVYLDLLDGGAWNAVLDVRTGSCLSATTTSLACEDDACGTSRPRFLGWLDPGTYYVLVDGRSVTDSGLFTLRYQGLPESLGCVADALPLTGDGRYLGSTTRGTNHVNSSCASMLGAPDVVYYFVQCPGTTVTATTCDAATDFDTALSVWRRGCSTSVDCNDNSAIDCRFGVGALASDLSIDAPASSQIQLLAVDGSGRLGSSGAYGLNVSGL